MATNLNLDSAFDIALVGIGRACIFMGIGFNTSKQGHIDYHLDGPGWLQIVPDKVPADTEKEFKDEFVAWTLGNGIRELVETFEVFLDRLFQCLLHIEAWRDAQDSKQSPEEVYQKRFDNFHRVGVRGKLAELQKRFPIDQKVVGYLESMALARNCLTHRLGIVSSKDVNYNECLRVSWCMGELFGHHEDGSEFVPSLDSFPIEFPKSSPVKFRQSQRSRAFRQGERVHFESGELKEICYTFQLAVQDLRSNFLTFARERGVVVNETEPGNSPKAA